MWYIQSLIAVLSVIVQEIFDAVKSGYVPQIRDVIDSTNVNITDKVLICSYIYSANRKCTHF